MIKNVQEEDSGKYTCEAANDGGVRQVTVELTVEGKRTITMLFLKCRCGYDKTQHLKGAR